jgi:hypothetical protein
MKKTFWLFVALLFPLMVRAEDPNIFISRAAGFSVTKPANWYFLTAEANAENLSKTRLQDEELQKMMQKYATAPLVIMTKFQEPYDDLNPSFKVNIRPLGSLDGANPVAIIELVKGSLQKAFKDYLEIQPPIEKEVAGFKAAYMMIHYSLETSDGQKFPTCSELWIIPRGKFFFMIGAGTNQVPDKNEQQEVASIINSIRIDK